MTTHLRHRRQWQIQDGARGTLHRLRSQLAEDGCSDSQLILAKNLLQESESCIGSFENAELAIHWLIQASDQANQDATNLLTSCMRSGKGISERNRRKVEECLRRCADEKQYRKAAHTLFCKMTSATGCDYVTVYQLQNKSEKLARGIASDDTVADSNDVSYNNNFDDYGLTLQDLQDNASSVYHGKAPEISVKDKFVSGSSATSTSTSKKVSSLPVTIFVGVYERILDLSAKQGQRIFLRWFLPTNQFHALSLVLLYALVTTETLMIVMPLFFCYVSTTTMVVSTLQMLHSRRALSDVRLWARLLRHYNPVLSAYNAESKFTWNNFSPYVQFLVSVIVLVLVLPGTSAPWIPYSEFTLLSLFFTLCTFVRLSDRPDRVTFASLVANVISSLPHLVSNVQVPSRFVTATRRLYFHKFHLGFGVELNVSLFSAFYILIPVLCFYMASKNRSVSVYQLLIPHAVCLVWWQVTVQFFQRTDCAGTLRASLLWFGVVSSFWLLGWLFILVACLFIVSVVFANATFLKLSLTTLLIVVPFSLSRWTKAKSDKWVKIGRRLKYFFVFLAFASTFYPILIRVRFSPDDRSADGKRSAINSLRWSDYYKECHKPAWHASSMAEVEVRCSPLTGAVVEWQGLVNLVRVVGIENNLEKFAGILPDAVARWLRCIYGDSDVDGIKHLYCQSQIECHLEKWNRYSFEIVLRMQTEGVDIFVDGVHFFKDYILRLRRGDVVKIKALLSQDVGGSRPRLQLLQSRCLTCSDKTIDEIVLTSNSVRASNKIVAAAKSCFEFFFFPLLDYHPSVPFA